jgi:hypothetical protein
MWLFGPHCLRTIPLCGNSKKPIFENAVCRQQQLRGVIGVRGAAPSNETVALAACIKEKPGQDAFSRPANVLRCFT